MHPIRTLPSHSYLHKSGWLGMIPVKGEPKLCGLESELEKVRACVGKGFRQRTLNMDPPERNKRKTTETVDNMTVYVGELTRLKSPQCECRLWFKKYNMATSIKTSHQEMAETHQYIVYVYVRDRMAWMETSVLFGTKWYWDFLWNVVLRQGH